MVYNYCGDKVKCNFTFIGNIIYLIIISIIPIFVGIETYFKVFKTSWFLISLLVFCMFSIKFFIKVFKYSIKGLPVIDFKSNKETSLQLLKKKRGIFLIATICVLFYFLFIYSYFNNIGYLHLYLSVISFIIFMSYLYYTTFLTAIINHLKSNTIYCEGYLYKDSFIRLIGDANFTDGFIDMLSDKVDISDYYRYKEQLFDLRSEIKLTKNSIKF